MSFKDEMDAINSKINLALDKSIRAATLQIGTAIIKQTPFDTGRARGNWQTTIGNPASAEINRTNESASVAELNNATSLMVGNKMYITNNLPYIYSLEYGSSRQAPQGMVRINVQKFNRVLAEQIQRFAK